MSVARFFERSFAAVGRHVAIDRETLEHRLAATTIGIACGESSGSGNDQIICELAVNLLARLYPRLAISAPTRVADHLAAIARMINPNIEIASTVATVWIAVGPTAQIATSIWPRASGWLAELCTDAVEDRGTENAYAAAAAACLAVSEVFRAVFVPMWQYRPHKVSLLDYEGTHGADETLNDSVFEDVSFVGLGAVGQAALWTMSRDSSISGSVSIIEPETIELSNLQRYVLTNDDDVASAKTDIACRALGHQRFRVKVHPSSLEECKELGAAVLVSVDSVSARRHVQARLPKLVVNGWTSDSGLGASWHAFDSDRACLACLYHPRGPSPSQTELAASALRIHPDRAALLWINGAGIQSDEMKQIAANLGVEYKRLRPWVGKPIQALYSEVICGYVGVDIKGIGQLEALPLAHQSVLAGVLAAAELRKRIDADLAGRAQPESLVAWFDVLREPPTHWRQARSRVTGCICTDATYQRVYAEKWNIKA